MSIKLDFVTVDVFTNVRFTGNPLAIVKVPTSITLTQDQKQKIAQEFNLSETVFLHDGDRSPNERKLDIFTTTAELPFAGHPTIGTICYIGHQFRPDPFGLPVSSVKLRLKAGLINAQYDHIGSCATAEIPQAFHIHNGSLDASVIATAQPSLTNLLLKKKDGNGEHIRFPLVSIVKGMTFALVELPSLSYLNDLHMTGISIQDTCRDELDENWNSGFIAPYYFVKRPNDDSDLVHRPTEEVPGFKFRTRMIEPSFGEDPATGSAACALACHQALRSFGNKSKAVQFEFEQGVEMGRRSMIKVTVQTDDASKHRRIENVSLEGQAIKVMEGTIAVEV